MGLLDVGLRADVRRDCVRQFRPQQVPQSCAHFVEHLGAVLILLAGSLLRVELRVTPALLTCELLGVCHVSVVFLADAVQLALWVVVALPRLRAKDKRLAVVGFEDWLNQQTDPPVTLLWTQARHLLAVFAFHDAWRTRIA